MEPENQPMEKEIPLETIIFRFHVKLWGCISFVGGEGDERASQHVIFDMFVALPKRHQHETSKKCDTSTRKKKMTFLK